MNTFGNIIVRSVAFGFAYVVATVLIRWLLNCVVGGNPIASSQSPFLSLIIVFVSGFIIALTLGPLTEMIRATRAKHLLIWSSIIFFNIASVVLEGSFFAPGLLPMAQVPQILFQNFLLAIISSILIIHLFSVTSEAIPQEQKPQRTFFSWTSRFLASAFSYLLFYFLFGALNYELFTKSYYQSHGGLAVPELKTVMAAEAIRAVLVILSIIPLLTALNGSKKKLVFISGSVLFIIGGIVPLLMQVGTLPAALLISSGVEIFFQNFLTGAVAALMLRNYTTHLQM